MEKTKEKRKSIAREKTIYSTKTHFEPQKKFYVKIAKFLSYFVLDPNLKMRLTNHVGKLEKPCLVLCNHGSFFDFAFAGRLLADEYPRTIAARYYFSSKFLGTLLKKLGCLPKSLFAVDVENARNCMRAIKNGSVLVMMPEARLCIAGKFEDIHETTYSFIQRMGLPVYTIKINGGYLARPKWSKKLRHGARVEADLRPLFAAGETKTLSLDEVKARVTDALYYNDLEWLKQYPNDRYKYRKLAEGLENILHICPHCKAKSTIKTKGRKVFCTECGFERTMDDRYAFTEKAPVENFMDWYDWQSEELRKEIETNPEYCLTDSVQLWHSCKGGKTSHTLVGEGVCTLDKTGLTYRGTDNGVQIEKHFPLANVHRITFGAGEGFDVYEGEETYYFTPEDKRTCVAWYIVSGLLHDVYDQTEKVA